MIATEYLKEHGLDPEFVKNKLGWNWDQEKIVIPVYDQDGNKLFDKYRWLNPSEDQPKFTSDKGSHPTLYNEYLIKNIAEVTLTEGEPDAARLIQEGIAATTTTGGVGKFDIEIAKRLAGKRVHLCLDTDEAGQKKILSYMQVFQTLNIEADIVVLPKNYKDVCEFFQENDRATFQALPHFTAEKWIIESKKELYPILSNKEFLPKEYPAKKWLVGKLLRGSGIQFLIGEGGVGKTANSYAIVKAISEGGKWLGEFQATKGKVLLLDKENEAIDIKTNLYAQGATSPDIFHYTAAESFAFMDEEGNPSDAAVFLNAYVKENQITTIVLDSMVDFFMGNENDAIDAARNANAWRETFPDCAILVIHHENKPSQGEGKRNRIHSMRGSSHLFNAAQAVINFSVPDNTEPEKIMVEHVKVRGARKHEPFTIEMLVADDPANPEETLITGFKYTGIVVDTKKKREEAMDAILAALEAEPDRWFTSQDLRLELNEEIGKRNIDAALVSIKENNLAAYTKKSNAFLYRHTDYQVDDETSKQGNLY